jgi:DNA-binding HxlR family transcriptional regulator
MNEPSDVMTLSGRSADRDAASAADWCPIERALKVIGTRSALVLLREAFWGARRFEDLARLAGITEQIAATRLRQLVDAGVLAKQPYKEPGKRTRYEYVLTARGRQIFPVIVSLIEFGLLLQGDANRFELVHGDGCGGSVMSQVQCAEGHMVALAQTEARISPTRSATEKLHGATVKRRPTKKRQTAKRQKPDKPTASAKRATTVKTPAPAKRATTATTPAPAKRATTAKRQAAAKAPNRAKRVTTRAQSR